MRKDSKEIKKYIKDITKPYKLKWWGSNYTVKPLLIKETQGDGLQFVGVEPLDTRPYWYLVRIDSKTDVEADNFNWDELLQMIEAEYDNADRYEHEWIKGKYLGKLWGEKDTQWESTEWPMLNWSGGRWWCQKNFGKVEVEE